MANSKVLKKKIRDDFEEEDFEDDEIYDKKSKKCKDVMIKKQRQEKNSS